MDKDSGAAREIYLFNSKRDNMQGKNYIMMDEEVNSYYQVLPIETRTAKYEAIGSAIGRARELTIAGGEKISAAKHLAGISSYARWNEFDGDEGTEGATPNKAFGAVYDKVAYRFSLDVPMTVKVYAGTLAAAAVAVTARLEADGYTAGSFASPFIP